MGSPVVATLWVLSLLALTPSSAMLTESQLLEDLSDSPAVDIAALQATVNATQTDCNAAVADAQASQQEMKLRLDSALKAAEYCHHAQSMLGVKEQVRASRTKKFVASAVQDALVKEKKQIESMKEELAACKAVKPVASECDGPKIAAIKLKSAAAICQKKNEALRKQMDAATASHAEEVDKLGSEIQSLRELQKTHKEKKKLPPPTDSERFERLEQDIHLLKAELAAKTKESASARKALLDVKDDCQGSRERELAETRELDLPAVSCMKLRVHANAVCEIVGYTSPSCSDLKSVMAGSCSRPPTNNEVQAAEETAVSMKLTADYDQLQEDKNTVHTDKDLLQAEQLRPVHSQGWTNKEQSKLKRDQAEETAQVAQHQQDVRKLKSLQKYNTQRDPSGVKPLKQGEPQSKEEQMLASKLQLASARVNSDYALMQEDHSELDETKDALRAARIYGSAGYHPAAWRKKERQQIHGLEQSEADAQREHTVDIQAERSIVKHLESLP